MREDASDLNDGPNLSPDQIGILVAEIEASVPRYAAVFNVEVFRVWTYRPELVPRLTYRGRPGKFVMRLALSDTTPQIELLQPVRGPSIYEEWLETHSPGLHHIGTFVTDLDSAVEAMRDAGYEPIQSGQGYGAAGDGGFAYFDTTKDLGIITELVEIPTKRRSPEMTWRDGSWQKAVGVAPAPAGGASR